MRRCIFLLGFFFVLNLLTSGLAPLWFIWPSLPFIAGLAWHPVAGKPEEKIEQGSHQPD